MNVLKGPAGVGRVHASGGRRARLLDGMERHFDQGRLKDRTWSVKDGLPEGQMRWWIAGAWVRPKSWLKWG